MSFLPISQLKTQYQTVADLFITEVNNSDLTLYYPPQTGLTNNSTNFNEQPTIIDEYGGRVHIDALPDRQDEQESNQYVNPPSESIKCRAYWEEKNSVLADGTTSKVRLCKIITYTTESTKLSNAIYAVVNGVKIKMLKSPAPYGLFEKRYCSSVWELI